MNPSDPIKTPAATSAGCGNTDCGKSSCSHYNCGSHPACTQEAKTSPPCTQTKDCDLGLIHTDREDRCEECVIHKEIIKKVEHAIPDDNYATSLSDLFKILGDPTRLKILLCLIKSEMCVCDLTQLLDKEQSAVSHQLRILRAMNLVKTKREGKSIFYSISNKQLIRILKTVITHS